MYNTFFKNCRTIFLICALSTISLANAQEVRVIDNKGTIETIRNNNVYTSSTDPVTITTNEVVEGDVWFDNTDPNNIITKIYDGTNWLLVNTKVSLLQDADSDTKIQVEEGADDDTIRFDTVGTQRLVVTTGGNVGIGVNNPNRLLDVGADIFVNGISLGRGGGNISSNLSLGTSSLNANTLGGNNTGVGSSTLLVNSTGSFNTAVGQAALAFGANPEGNVAVGSNALIFASGQGNIAIGRRAGDGLTTGDFNIIIGNNIEVPSLTGDNQLNIGNAIYGNLATGNIGIGTTTPTQRLDVLGSARIDEFIFDENNESGTVGQILSTTATGIDWVNASSTALIQDADSDTKIQVEEGADDDTIRFDTAGTERVVITPTGNINLTTANRIISGNTGLTLQQTGDTFGSTALHIRNRNGENGATFEQLGSVDLVDFAFKTLSNQMNLRVEDRATYVSFADPEFQFSTNTTTFANLGINGGDPALLLRNGTTRGSVYFGNTAHGVKRNFASTANDVGLFTTSGAIRLSTNGETPGEFVLTDTGNVGIGTTTPTQRLDVLGSARIDEFIFDENNESGTVGQILSTTATGIDWVNAPSTALIQDADTDTKIQVEEGTDDDTIRFDTAGTERAVISATGNVGIETSNPVTQLSVGSDLVIDNNTAYDADALLVTTNRLPTSNTVLNDPIPLLQLAREGTGGQAWGARANLSLSRFENTGVAANTRLDFQLANADFLNQTNVMTLLSNGNVGIGTTAPTETLDVRGGAHLGVMPVFNTEGTVKIGRADNAAIRFHEIKARNGNSASTNWMQFNIHNAASTSSVSNVLTLRGDERVGISTTAPTNKLTINANIVHDNNFNYSTAQQTIFDPNTNGGNSPNGTRDILHLVREGIGSQAFGNKASFALGRYENVGTRSRSQLDIKLTDGSFNAHNSIMSLRSNGNVGIGTTAPTQKLDVLGSARIDEFIFDENNESGTAGQILSTTATGIDWVNASSTVLIQDADSDTKIQVEETADEDIIRFDTAGTERAVISATGNVGIGTDSPQAMLDINTTVSAGNTIPLRIRPNTTTPTGTASGEFHVAADGLLYTYDASRSKWLSVDRNMIGWGRDNNNTTNQYLRQYDGARSNRTGWRTIRNGTITAITVQGNANQTYTVQIRKNDATTVIASLAVAGAQGNHNNTINVDFNEGDFLQCYLNGNSIDFPQVLIEVAWRQ